MVQEASFTLDLLAAGPLLEKPDVIVAVSPSLASLSAAITVSRARAVPWVLWLQDMVADAAHTTDLVRSHGVLRVANRLESAAYRSAAHIVVVSDAFRRKLVGMRVPDSKISTSYNPATFPVLEGSLGASDERQVIIMGNIGRSQGLPRLVSAFERSAELQRLGARLLITGEGVTSDELRNAITTDRIEYLGVIPRDDLIQVVDRSAVGLVSQRPGLVEFNLPSKLMNYMARGLPVIASVDTGSETANLVRESGAGWVTDPADLDQFCETLANILVDEDGRDRAGAAGLQFARRALRPSVCATRFEEIARAVTNQSR
jgi:colanic acid biosynthesis glycosyl transferase WcaI